MERTLLVLAALLGFLAVALGAFGAHALKGRLSPEMLTIFDVGVRYHFYHVSALLATAWAYSRWPKTLILTSGWLFIVGIVLFSGSLYLLSITGIKALGAITPLGGLAFMIGWLCLAWAIWRQP